ncbi:hypothetical protein ACFQZC_20290 [Streptacidiphilus monticola]
MPGDLHLRQLLLLHVAFGGRGVQHRHSGLDPALPLGGYRKQNPPETCRFTEQVTKNVLQEFARGPVGRRHPAVDNYQEYARPFPEDMPYSWEF